MLQFRSIQINFEMLFAEEQQQAEVYSFPLVAAGKSATNDGPD